MKKLTTVILISLNTICLAQDEYKPSNPDKNLGAFAGAYLSANLVEYLEIGALGGVNFKDRLMVGGFYQRSLENDYYGSYAQLNINPKSYWFTVGIALRVGLAEGKYIVLEPAITMQNVINKNVKLIHQIGITGGFPSYNIGVAFGNFGKKWWK